VGDAGGKINVEIFNDGAASQNITYFESIPWIIKLYLHTLTVTVGDEKGKLIVLTVAKHELFYQPARDRVRPTILELTGTIPAMQKMEISFEFDPSFIKLTEHHPDADHGFDIGMAKVIYGRKVIWTESLLVRLPLPDPAMPYNVITLSCTVLSLFFAAVFNFLTGDAKAIKEVKKK
jgi:phosphatidylinositol glycan class T